MTTTTTTAQKTEKSASAYESFVAALQALCTELDVPVKVSVIKSWVNFESTVNKHKFYVPRSADEMGLCETTLPLADTTPGYAPLPKPNGKIACRFEADLDLIEEHVLPLLASSAERLPANRKPARKAKEGETSEPTPVIDFGI